MNCEQLQENLYDYLDDTLSPVEKAAAEKHLLDCSFCHEAVQRELLLAETISNRFRQAVECVALDENKQRKMARAVERSDPTRWYIFCDRHIHSGVSGGGGFIVLCDHYK